MSSEDSNRKGLVIALSKPFASDPLSLELLDDKIRLAFGKDTELVIDHAGIRLEKTGQKVRTELKLEGDRVTVGVGETRASFSPQDLKLSSSMARLTLAPTSAEIDIAGPKVRVDPASMTLSSGAAKIVMNGPLVNINDGGLEVL